MPSPAPARALTRLAGPASVAVTALLLLSGCLPTTSNDAPTGADDSPAPDVSDSASIDATAGMDDSPAPDAPDASDGASEEVAGSTTSSQHTATLVMAGQSFTFSPTMCVLDDEEVMVYGPGADDDSSDPAFLDIGLYSEGDFTHGEVRIELGTDQQFDSREEFFVAFAGGLDDFELTYDDDSLVFDGEFRFAGDGQLGPGTVQVNCG